MENVIGPIIIGIFVCILGGYNMKGHISSLHWYHRKRVTEENKIVFGRIVGLGTIVIGVSMIFYGIFTYIINTTQNNLIISIRDIITLVVVIIGLIISFYAMIKYNKGIF